MPVGDMVPVDLSATYRFERTSGLQHGLSVRVSALNAFNDKPAHVENFNDYDPPYDSTNYSVVGRFLSLTISKTW